MFRIRRKNKQPYSLSNFNGSVTSIRRYLETDSSVNGDLLNNVRPDKICYDVIDESDVLDLRHAVSIDILNEYYLNKNLQDLFTGDLVTNKKPHMRRVQFGRQYVDYTENSFVILHAEFNNNIDPTEIENLPSTVEFFTDELSYQPIYKDSILAQGLYIDGRAEYKYTLTGFRNDIGTIDFYMQPNWDGHSKINQTLFTVVDLNGNNVFRCYKRESQLLFNIVFAAATADHGEIAEQIVIDLTKYLIFAKRIYMIRIAWNNSADTHHFYVYLNGTLVGQTDFEGTVLIPKSIIVGNKNDAINYAGLVIDPEDVAAEEWALTEPAKPEKEIWLRDDEIELAEACIGRTQESQLIMNYHNMFLAVPNNDLSDATEETIFYNFEDVIITDLVYQDDNNIISRETEDLTEIQQMVLDFVDSTITSTELQEIASMQSSLTDDTDDNINADTDDNDEEILDISNYKSRIRFMNNAVSDQDEIQRIIAEEQLRIIKKQEEEFLNDTTNYSARKAKLAEINRKRTNNNYGFIIDELVIYAQSYEKNVNDGVYVYTSNSYWPGLPNDFIAGEALILPSFNSIYRCYSDVSQTQDDTIQIVTGEKGVFRIQSTEKRQIIKEPVIYNILGDVDNEGHILTLPGVWHFVRDEWIFLAEDTTLTSAVVKYSIHTPSGNGFEDLPDEMLAAGLVTNTTILEESAFARKNTTDFRPVPYLLPRIVNADVDRAYDHSTSKGVHSCYSRIVYYHLLGNRTNLYVLPAKLYGLNIVSILYVTNRKILNVKKIAATETQEAQFEIYLTESVSFDDTIEFVIALGGMTFDYNTETKTLISNLLRTQSVVFTADGIHSHYLIPVYTQNGGIVQSVCSITEIDSAGNEIFKHVCYVDGEMYPYRAEKDEDGHTLSTYSNQLAELTIDETSWHTPFIKIAFDYTPPDGAQIEIPMQVTYQPTQYDVFSLWYTYTPYQGILDKSHKKLKRLTDWKYFITTLSSGSTILKPDDYAIHTLNNTVNRLPGGNTYASYLTGEKIIFKDDLSINSTTHLFSPYTVTEKELDNGINSINDLNFILDNKTIGTVDINQRINMYLKADANYELRFLNKALFASKDNKLDDAFFELAVDLEIYRQTIGFQDETLNYKFNKFKAYLPDTITNISKYTGMACLVVDEVGEILLFVIGSINNGKLNDNIKSRENILEPIYGDLFKLPNLPTTLQRSYSLA